MRTGDNRVVFRVTARGAAQAQEYRVKPGQRFATHFRLVAYGSRKSRDCATLLYGDLPLSMCEGDTFQGA